VQARYEAAPTFDGFVDAAQQNKPLWTTMYKLARVPESLVARVRALPARLHLLVLNEDWCGDSVNTLPAVAKLASLVPEKIDLRVVGRDANPDLMDSHLTGTSRSIPVVIVLDDDYVEHGWWGPRPKELQSWALGPGKALEKADRYREIRRWYARDRALTTLEELVTLMERAAAESPKNESPVEGRAVQISDSR
jgi:thioredoxin family protein